MVSLVAGVGLPGSRFDPPPLPAEFVPRERLRTLVEEATTTAAVTTLCAHAGAGKTLLLADWARRSAVATAWVSLGPADDRPGRLWTAVAQAVTRSVPALADALTGSTAADTADRTSAGRVLSVLDALPEELRLVLDGMHELTAPEALDDLRTMIRYRPERLRLVLAGRTPPASALPRLRLQGGVVDLRGDELALSPDEAAAVISRHGIVMSPDHVGTAHELTGGWATGIHLIALAARRSGDGPGLVEVFARSERSIAAYVDAEVLGPLPAADRAFLEDVSVCESVTPSLAGALSGRDDALAVLERLERETSLVTTVPPDGPVVVPTLLRTSLYRRLGRERPVRRAELHARAVEWYSAEDRPADAIDHARASGDAGLVATLLRAWAVRLLLTGEHDAVRRACAALAPAAVGGDQVRRRVLHTLEVVTGDRAALTSLEDPADGAMRLRVLRGIADLAAFLDEDDDGRTQDRARSAGPLAEAVDGATRLFVTRDRPGAVAVLEGAATRARDLGLHHLAMQCSSLLATAGATVGDAVRMTSHGTEVIAADPDGRHPSVWADAARSALAYGALLGARPAEARGHAADLLAHAEGRLHPARELLVTVLHGAADADTGRITRGLEEMQQARTGFADRELTGSQAALVAMLEHGSALVLGRSSHAHTVRRWLVARVGQTGDVALMSAREALLADPDAPVGQALRPVVQGSVPTLLPDTAIEALLLETGDALLARDRARARRLLITALDRAAPLDLMRPFTHAAWGVRELMAHQVGSFGAADGFARRALATGIQGRPTSRTGLSERESTILRLLPSLSTTNEIADDLNVSPNTVKTQVGAIYSKLGVNDRRAAVVAAYDAGLLGDPDRAGSAPAGPVVVPWPRTADGGSAPVIRSG